MKVLERRSFGYGKGAIVKFDDGPNWYSCYSVRGREHRESTATSDEKQARRFHKQRLDELALDRQNVRKFTAPLQQRTTVDALLDAYVADAQLRELKSATSLRHHMTPVRAWFGARRAGDVTADAVDRNVRARQQAGKAPAPINRETQLLGGAFKLAVRRGAVTAGPAIRRLPERNTRTGFFEREQFEAVLQHLPEHLRDVATFGYVTGWRKSEIVTLQWTAVDLTTSTITLGDSKNGRPRVVALAGNLAALMRRRQAARLIETPDGDVRVSDFVFHQGGRSVGDFKQAWHTALAKAGLSHQEKNPDGSTRTVYDRLFHDLRRTAARNMVRAGVREGVAMRVTGHRTRSMFDRYAIVATDDVRDAMERVSRSGVAVPE